MPLNSGGTNFKPITKKIKPCKVCLKKPRLGNLSLCSGCQKTHERNRRAKKKEARLLRVQKSKERKANSPKRLKKELDRVFSIYIRRRYADKQGNIICVCCGRTLPWQEAQNMHYISRANMNTRWDTQNCFPGCVGCNVFKNGNYPAYTKHLLENYGESFLKGLIWKGEQIKQWRPEELKEMILKYTELQNF